MHFLMVPGIGGSDADHWQTYWESELDADRIVPASWSKPDETDWLAAITRKETTRTVLVAHSLGCLAVTSWLAQHPNDSGVTGAFLVAPPDEAGPVFPKAASSFSTTISRMPVPTLVVASSNDPYATSAVTERLAAAWGAPVVEAGALGHMNSASKLGRWSQGFDYLTSFTAGLARPLAHPRKVLR